MSLIETPECPYCGRPALIVNGDIWVGAAGWRGFYEVNSLGTVRSLARNYVQSNGKICRVRPKTMSQWNNDAGYPCVSLRLTRSARKMERVHRLVARAFIPNPGALPEVNHKDGNKQHRCYGNLEWVTHTANVEHAVLTGLTNRSQAGNFGELNPNAKLTNEQAEEIRGLAALGMSQSALAKKFNVSRPTIKSIVVGRTYPQQQSDLLEGP